MRPQSAYQRVIETTRTEYNGGPRMPRKMNYENDNCRFGRVMKMIRAGATDGEIVYEYPEFFAQIDVLNVSRAIADGTISRGMIYTRRSTAPLEAQRRRAHVVAMMLNGMTEEEICEETGYSAETVRYYLTGHHPHKRGKKR